MFNKTFYSFYSKQTYLLVEFKVWKLFSLQLKGIPLLKLWTFNIIISSLVFNNFWDLINMPGVLFLYSSTIFCLLLHTTTCILSHMHSHSPQHSEKLNSGYTPCCIPKSTRSRGISPLIFFYFWKSVFHSACYTKLKIFASQFCPILCFFCSGSKVHTRHLWLVIQFWLLSMFSITCLIKLLQFTYPMFVFPNLVKIIFT